MRGLISIAMAAVVVIGLANRAFAQQVTVGTPFNSVSNSFFENIGGGFGFSIPGTAGAFPLRDNSRGIVGIGPNGLQPNINFQQGNAAVAPFGGFNAAAATGGFGLLTKNGSAFFNFSAGQGSSSAITSTTPMITVMNGASGFISDVTQRPFVTGVVPVVGGWPSGPTYSGYAEPMPGVTAPYYSTPLEERLARLRAGEQPGPRTSDGSAGGSGSQNPAPSPDADPQRERLSVARSSTAGQAAESIRDIQAQQSAAQEQAAGELAEYLEKARAAEQDGKLGAARAYYQMAERRATGALADDIRAKLRALAPSPGSRQP